MGVHDRMAGWLLFGRLMQGPNDSLKSHLGMCLLGIPFIPLSYVCPLIHCRSLAEDSLALLAAALPGVASAYPGLVSLDTWGSIIGEQLKQGRHARLSIIYLSIYLSNYLSICKMSMNPYLPAIVQRMSG